MKCLNPIWIDSDEIDLYPSGKISVPCGKCEVCRNDDSLSWRIRLKEHFYSSENAYFVTLTYDDAHLPFDNITYEDGRTDYVPVVCKRDVQNFFKRFRFEFESYYKEKDFKFSYFLVSEYGPTFLRPHYHAILFNLPVLSSVDGVQDKQLCERIERLWNKGFIKIDKCNEARICYCTKYMSCQTYLPYYLPRPFRLISRYIGYSYLSKLDRINWHKEQLNCYYPDGIYKCKLPRYYRDKIFSDDEKIMISELMALRREKAEENLSKLSKEELQQISKDFASAVIKYKRNYENKSVKKRKDL